MTTSLSSHVGAVDFDQLRTQNEQLWKIIERQRTKIQALQKENSLLMTERDGLQDKVNGFEHHHYPMPPTRSPYRSNNNNNHEPVLPSGTLSTNNNTLDIDSPQQPQSNILLDKGDTPSALSPCSSKRMANNTSFLRPHSPTVVVTEGAVAQNGGYSRVKRKSQLLSSPTPASGVDLDAPGLATVKLTTTTSTSSPLPPLPPIYNLPSGSSSSISSFSTSTSSTTLLSPGTSSTSLAPSTFENGIIHNNITIKVLGSNIRQNEKSREVISFVISIGRKQQPDEGNTDVQELWRVEKLYSHFLELDSKITRAMHGRPRVANLPDKSLFTTHSPSKIDRRKAALDHYLQHLLSLPVEDNSDICDFLSTNVVDASVKYSRTGRKEGYLTKRGKNFGGWKTRYFVLRGSSLEYYDTKEGSHLGTIRLLNAQIGRQTPGVPSVDDGSSAIYRHAFLIVEQKRSGSSYLSRHILCATSDEERDSWVDALFKIVSREDEKQQPPSTELSTSHSNSGLSMQSTSVPSTQSSIKVNKGPSPPPIVFDQPTNVEHSRPSRPTHHLTRRSSMVNLLNPNDKDKIILPARAVSPSPAFNRQSDDLLGHDLPEKKTKHKRMTLWGKKKPANNNNNSNDDLTVRPSPSFSLTAHQHTVDPSTTAPSSSSSSSSSSLGSSSGLRGLLSRPSHENAHKGTSRRPVFGIPLDESVLVSRVSAAYQLPSIVFRCIEYLNVKKAVLEEGLYRLSGSNVMIKSLKQRFDLEGDIDLLAEKEEYDVHAVAGLLKMWLRELPTSVLTREYRMDFLHVIDLLDHKDRVNELGRLVALLPIANYTLLRALTAHLIQVIQHSDVNKMTLRNVSIVFSPTVGIPGTIFNLLISEFDYIFWTTNHGATEDSLKDGMKAKRSALKFREGSSNRNSVDYCEAAPTSIVDLEKQHQGQPLVLDDMEDEMGDLTITDKRYLSLEDDPPPTAIAT